MTTTDSLLRELVDLTETMERSRLDSRRAGGDYDRGRADALTQAVQALRNILSPWLRTPMTGQAMERMEQLWTGFDLPPVPGGFQHWSAEYARQIWEVVAEFTKPDWVKAAQQDSIDPREYLIEALKRCDVYDTDERKHQWVPIAV